MNFLLIKLVFFNLVPILVILIKMDNNIRHLTVCHCPKK